ncbi:hypothetical protein MTR67_043646 [Solanum verrucosum]|uniref:MULE transposase domain-containing protein n=1 Tax=Solanum verrucosum TaxID=315347 RepID=A0AAF0USD0_SOLVR|nr:hypothetical protein MTR67_043646 [Solanum verrucosum]
MESTSQNSQLNDVLNNVLGLAEDDSLLSQNDEHHEDSDDAYDGPEHYLHSDDEDVINKLFEEMNQLEQEESISVSDREEYEAEEECDEQTDSANDDNFSNQQYMEGPLVDMVYCSVESLFAFYKEHSRLNEFGVLKKTSKKRGCEYARPAKSIRLLEVQAGGQDRMGCTPKDCRNYILQQRRMRTLSCDAAAIHKFSVLMQMKDDEFFYVIDTDNVGRLRNVVWVHTHSKYAYREFSDVVCFNSTYLVNQWRMSFASFVGVNQHKQSILLGCALLTSEDIETYKFVFSTWLAAMGNAPPTAILTDQCESIKATIAEELQAEADSRKKHAAPCSGFDWDLQLQTHYTRPIYDAFAAEHLKRLYHCEIERHHDFNVVEGVEKYSVTDYSISNDFHVNRFVYIVEYRPQNQYLDCNCKNFQSESVVYCHILKTMSPCRIKMFHDRYILRRWRRDVIRPHIDLKNILKGRFNAYCNWNDEMAVPSVGDPDSEEDVTFIRNPREVRTRGRPPTNRCRRGGGRWNRTYYHAHQVGETSQGRRGGGRRGVGRRAGRGGRGGGIMA